MLEPTIDARDLTALVGYYGIHLILLRPWFR